VDIGKNGSKYGKMNTTISKKQMVALMKVQKVQGRATVLSKGRPWL